MIKITEWFGPVAIETLLTPFRPRKRPIGLAPRFPGYSPNTAGFSGATHDPCRFVGRPYILMALFNGLQFGQRRKVVWPDEFHAFESETSFHDYA